MGLKCEVSEGGVVDEELGESWHFLGSTKLHEVLEKTHIY